MLIAKLTEITCFFFFFFAFNHQYAKQYITPFCADDTLENNNEF